MDTEKLFAEKLLNLEKTVEKQKDIEQELRRLNEAISLQAQSLEAMRSQNAENQANEQKPEMLKKSGFAIRNANALANLTKSESKKHQIYIEKNVTAPYARGNQQQDFSIRFNPTAFRPYLHEVFEVTNTDASEWHYTDISSAAISVESSNSAGCFTVLPSAVTLTAYTSTPYTFRDLLVVCDTHLEDYPQLLASLDSLMANAMLGAIDSQLYTQLVASGLSGALAPSYTALAGAVPSATIWDLAAIHSNDIAELTNNRLRGDVMFLNPIDYARLLTAKTTENRDIMVADIGVIFIPNGLIPAGQYLLVSRESAQIKMLREATVEIVAGSHSEAAQGTRGIVFSMRAHIIVPAINSNGIIYGDIATEIANY